MNNFQDNNEINSNANPLARLKLKVCGMHKNTQEIAALKPDYLGFIFWEPSSRFFKGSTPQLDDAIDKVGVFVDEKVAVIIEKVQEFGLALVQLHGHESVSFCAQLKKELPHIKIIKVFAIQNDFKFEQVAPFEAVCDFFMFDTKGKLPGGNGYAFNWELLQNYPSKKPYFLSGGIGTAEFDAIAAFMKRPEAQYCYAIDVNSKFEIEPGLKDVGKVALFKQLLSQTYTPKTKS